MNQYLVRIKTVTGKTLYIDDQDIVWSKDLAEDPYLIFRFSSVIDWSKDDIHPVYFDDLEEAIEMAELYGGEVVECKFVVEPVKRRGERSEKEENKEPERSCKNCIFAEFAVSGLPIRCSRWATNIYDTEACVRWKGENDGGEKD